MSCPLKHNKKLFLVSTLSWTSFFKRLRCVVCLIQARVYQMIVRSVFTMSCPSYFLGVYYMHVCMFAWTHVCMCVCVYACIYACMFVCTDRAAWWNTHPLRSPESRSAVNCSGSCCQPSRLKMLYYAPRWCSIFIWKTYDVQVVHMSYSMRTTDLGPENHQIFTLFCQTSFPVPRLRQ